MAQVKLTLGIGFAGANHEDTIEIPDERKWRWLSEDEKNAVLDDYWKDWSANDIDGGVEIL